MEYPSCPVCGKPELIVTAMFTTIDLTHEECRYYGHLDASGPLRAPLHAVLIAGIRKLRTDYGLIVPPDRSQRWFSEVNPVTALTILEGWLHDAARETALLRPCLPTDISLWQRARDNASAGIAVWLSCALYTAVLAAADQVEGRAA